MSLAGLVSVAERDTWLRQWRIAHAKQQDECADAVQISRSRWAEIEAGASPSFALAQRIEDYTGIAARDFHKRTRWRKPQRGRGKR